MASLPNPLLDAWETPHGLPPFERLRAEHFVPAVETAMAAHRAELDAIKGAPEAASFENTIVALEASGRLLERVTLLFENLTASARRIALATLGDTSSRNASMIARNTSALRAAIDLADNISPNTIRAMHERLDGGDDPANTGRFRTQPVWIGGSSPVTAQYVPVHHLQIGPAIDDLVAFIRRDDLQPLVQAAIAHAQFESIHPFTDGNGRTGRALVSSILRRRGVAPHMSVPISSGLLGDTGAYFTALSEYRMGHIEPIIDQFGAAARRAIANARILRGDVSEVRRAVLTTAQRGTHNLMVIADLCGSEPAFNAAMLAERDVPSASAYRILARLREHNIVRQERPIAGAMVWTVPGLTSALDRFAERAGRRTFIQS